MIKIFIADDHSMITFGIQALLSQEKDKEVVGIANSNQHLVKLLMENKADVLILDLNMPGYGHKPLIKELRRNFKSLKIIVYTAYKEVNVAKPVLKLGIDGYVLKNDLPYHLIKAIDSAYQGGRFISTSVELSEAYAQSDDTPSPNEQSDIFQKIQKLTPRELEICKLISKARTSQNIADTLYISKHTVETHRKNILRKLNVNNIVELIHLMTKLGLNNLTLEA